MKAPLFALPAGTRFCCPVAPGLSMFGTLVECTEGWAVVVVDTPDQVRRFTDSRTGATVEFVRPGGHRTTWARSVMVEVEI